VSVVLQPGGVERGLFPFVLIVFRNFAPIQSAGPAPAIDDDSLLERLVACSDHHAIALSGGPLISNTPVKHQRLELELLQGFADITRPMAAVATLSQADVNQEALKLRVENNMIFAFETTRCRMRGHRRQLGLARIHVRCESYERVAQVLIDLSSLAAAASTRSRSAKTREMRRITLNNFLYSLETSCGGQCRISHLSTPARCPADSSLRGNVGRYFCVLLNSRLFEIFQLFARRDCVARFGVNANPTYPYVLPI